MTQSPTTPPQGLSELEAARRLETEGPNELGSEKKPRLWVTLFGVIKEPMILLLLGAGGLYLVLGDAREAVTLMGFVVVVIGITLVQERKTERALTALRNLSSPRALVIREGEARRIAGRDVVRGDVLVLAEGDRVSADSRLHSQQNLLVDESLLTGESNPVRKAVRDDVPNTRPGGDDLPFVYAGTLVVKGRALAEVTATGPRTEFGKIGRALTDIRDERTSLQHEIDRIIRIVAIVGLALCLALVLMYGFTRGDFLRGLLAGISLAMAVLPEEFPVVLTVFFALGAFRLSQKRVLARRMPAIEALGAATALCADKTGTITENRMKVAELWTERGEHVVTNPELPEVVHETVEFGILASQRDPFDPVEIAFNKLGHDALSGTEHLHETWELVREYPLSPELLSISQVWREPGGTRYVVAAKGAPEAILDLCHADTGTMDRVLSATSSMAKKGLRVLGIARAYFEFSPLPLGQHDFEFELVGLAGLTDPVRAEVPSAVLECKQAGIKVLMITGDYPETATAIARLAGIESPDAILTGAELEELTDDELNDRLRTTSVFARAVPEQKLRIVQALKSHSQVVAMTGDGVNDAPALRAAHIGIAMGRRGTDVAREAAALVLVDDNFTSIVDAIRMGRRVYDNMQKAIAYVVAVHVPIAGMSLLPVLMGWPLVLFPVHIAFLELMVDPACSVAFEAEGEEPGIMTRRPRPAKSPLLGVRTVLWSAFQGMSVLVAAAIVFAVARRTVSSEDIARALSFAALIGGNVALILLNRSWKKSLLAVLMTPNIPSWIVIVGAVSTLGLALYLPALSVLFRFAAPVPAHSALAFAAGFASVLWFEPVKILFLRRSVA